MNSEGVTKNDLPEILQLFASEQAHAAICQIIIWISCSCHLVCYCFMQFLDILDCKCKIIVRGWQAFAASYSQGIMFPSPNRVFFSFVVCVDLFLPLAWSYQKQADNTIWTRLFLLLSGIPAQEIQHSCAFFVREIWLAPCIYCEGAVERIEESGRSNGRGALKACGRYGRSSKDWRKDLQSQILIHFLLARGVRLDWAPNFVCH